MEIYTIQRPSLLPPAAVCAPSASWSPYATSPVVAAAKPAPAPRAHQVQTQAELARELVLTSGSNGITGFVGSNGPSDGVKRMTDGASGVPPRGRPV
jgi:3-oxoacyl-ACP reductase-like protein